MTRPTYDTIVCLVSEQAIPNLTPVLDPAFRPARVALVVSDDSMAQRAAWLGRVLERHGLPSSIERLQNIDDFAAMLQRFRDIAARHPRAALNATGGKKTMTLAAFRAFTDDGCPVFYVERDNRLHWIEPAQAQPVALAGVLSLADLLAAHGQEIVERHTAADPRAADLARLLMDDAPRERTRALIELGPVGEGDMKNFCLKNGGDFAPRHLDLLKQLQNLGLVSRQGKRWQCGRSEAALLAGGWLEQHVWGVLNGLAPRLGLRDVCHGLKIAAVANAEIRNEIDAAFVRDNRLYLVECKALKPLAAGKSVADFIYTLESVRKGGGLAARAALLVWGMQPGPAVTARAEENRIRVLAGPTLGNLELALTTWITAR